MSAVILSLREHNLKKKLFLFSLLRRVNLNSGKLFIRGKIATTFFPITTSAKNKNYIIV